MRVSRSSPAPSKTSPASTAAQAAADLRVVSSQAMANARWETADILSRRSVELAADMVSGRAAELALSPGAIDQIQSLYLERAADALRIGRPPLSGAALVFKPIEGPIPGSEAALNASAAEAAEADPLAAQAEAAHRETGLVGALLSARLVRDAVVHEALSQDARIPADERTRRIMALTASLLRGRARRVAQEAADPGGGASTQGGDAVARLRRPDIVLGDRDHARLQSLAMSRLLDDPRAAAPLLQELDRAVVVPQSQVSESVVRPGAWVEFQDLHDGQERRILLTAEPAKGSSEVVPVFSTLGSALIGLSAGQSILWRDHYGGERLLKVTAVGPPA